MSPGKAPAWAAHHLLTLHTQTLLYWGKPQPCSVFGDICAISKVQSLFGIPHRNGTAELSFGHQDYLEAPVAPMVFLRDLAIGFPSDHAWDTRLR